MDAQNIDDNAGVGIGTSNVARTKRGTPNKRWKAEYDNFLISVLVEQVNKGLKCDKTFKKPAFVFVANAVNSRFSTSFTAYNVDNHYRTLKTRYAEMKKARELSGAGWNDEEKMITLPPAVYKAYVEAHPNAIPYINKPLPNYEGLCIICGDDNATGSYASSMFGNLDEGMDDEDADPDNGQTPLFNEDVPVHIPSPPVSSPGISASRRTQRQSKRDRVQAERAASQGLADALHALSNAIQTPVPCPVTWPVPWPQLLYERVMEVEGFNDNALEEVFDYLHQIENMHEAEGFVVKSIRMRHAWVERFMLSHVP